MEVGFSLPARLLGAIDGTIIDAGKLEHGSLPWLRGGRRNERLLALQSLEIRADKIIDAAQGTNFESWAAQGAALIRPFEDANLASRKLLTAHARQAREAASTLRNDLLDQVQSGELTPGPAAAVDDSGTIIIDSTEAAAELDLALAVAMRESEDPAAVLREHVAPYFLRDPADLSKGEWRHLERILTHERTAPLLPTPIREPGDRPLADVAAALGSRIYNVGAPTRKAFARMTFALDGTLSDPARMRAHLDDLVMRNPRELTGSDWARMDVLIREARTTDLGFTVPSRREVSPKVRELHDVLDGLTSESFDPSTGTLMHVRALRERLQPGMLAERDQQLVAAIQQGEVPPDTMPEELSADSPIWGRVDASLKDQLGTRTRLIAWSNESPSTRRHARLFLDGIEQGLKHVPREDPTIDDLARDVERLISANRKRLQGRTPSGSVSGYANYPEFAELGRIGANTQLLARLAYPFEPATAVTPVTPTLPGAAADAGEAIAW